MTRVPCAVLALVAGSLPVAVPPDSPHTARLVTQLGSEAFAEREAAEKDLEALGGVAVEQLWAACRSPNPEVARRAEDVLARVERKVANEKALAPTRVQLKAENVALGDVLADLSKQSGYRVVFEGPNAEEIEQDRITVQTGRVPFWQAVVAVCDAGELEITSVAGFYAPGTRPDPTPAHLAKAVVLGARGLNKRRPAAVYGAVLVEAFEVPNGAAAGESATALLHVWPEPKLNWLVAKGVSVWKAADTAGRLLAARPDVPVQPPQAVPGRNAAMVRNRQGGIVVVNPRAPDPPPGIPAINRTPRQSLVFFKPTAEPSATLAELAGTVRGTVRSGNEPLISLTGLKPGVAAEGSHPAGAEMKATLTKTADGKWRAEIALAYDQRAITAADANGSFPAGKIDRGVLGKLGNTVVLGLRVTDADGNAFMLLPTVNRVVNINRTATSRIDCRFEFPLTRPERDGGDPDTVTFWGTRAVPVEVPFVLRDVPLSGGKK